VSYILSGAGFITQRYKKEGTGQKPVASRFVKKLGGLEIFLYFCEDQNVRQMKIREEFKVREMAGEHVIVMPGRGGAADMTRIVSLNPSSMYLWEKLRGREFTAADAALLLTERYEVDADTARKDAGRWIASLAECGIVEE
jgi:hypothetical protein